MHLLIVESHPADVRIISEAVFGVAWDIQAEVASSIEEIGDRIHRADVVLLEVEESSTAELQARLAPFLERGERAIVICSVESDPQVAIEAGYLGAFGSWLKGGDPKQLVQTLYCAIGAWRRREDERARLEALKTQLIERLQADV